MNLAEMRTLLRAQAQTDSEDAPDNLLEMYARAAYQDITSRVQQWPHLHTTFTFDTVVGQAKYTFNNFTATDLEFVEYVFDGEDVLIPITETQYRDLVGESSGSAVEATCYAVDDTTGMWLWPTPSSVKSYTVSGYRQFAEWPSGSNDPDLPRGFDEVILWYMLSKYYASQEDIELSIQYMRDYETQLSRQIGAALRSSKTTAGPMIFGGDPRLDYGMSYSQWVKKGVEG